MDELRATDNFFKTTMCCFYRYGASCKLGNLCRHAHSREELKVLPANSRRYGTSGKFPGGADDEDFSDDEELNTGPWVRASTVPATNTQNLAHQQQWQKPQQNYAPNQWMPSQPGQAQHMQPGQGQQMQPGQGQQMQPGQGHQMRTGQGQQMQTGQGQQMQPGQGQQMQPGQGQQMQPGQGHQMRTGQGQQMQTGQGQQMQPGQGQQMQPGQGQQMQPGQRQQMQPGQGHFMQPGQGQMDSSVLQGLNSQLHVITSQLGMVQQAQQLAQQPDLQTGLRQNLQSQQQMPFQPQARQQQVQQMGHMQPQPQHQQLQQDQQAQQMQKQLLELQDQIKYHQEMQKRMEEQLNFMQHTPGPKQQQPFPSRTSWADTGPDEDVDFGEAEFVRTYSVPADMRNVRAASGRAPFVSKRAGMQLQAPGTASKSSSSSFQGPGSSGPSPSRSLPAVANGACQVPVDQQWSQRMPNQREQDLDKRWQQQQQDLDDDDDMGDLPDWVRTHTMPVSMPNVNTTGGRSFNTPSTIDETAEDCFDDVPAWTRMRTMPADLTWREGCPPPFQRQHSGSSAGGPPFQRQHTGSSAGGGGGGAALDESALPVFKRKTAMDAFRGRAGAGMTYMNAMPLMMLVPQGLALARGLQGEDVAGTVLESEEFRQMQAKILQDSMPDHYED